MKTWLISVLVVLTLWTVIGGGQEKKDSKKSTGPISSFTKEDESRVKSVLAKSWELKDPLATSYAVLAYSAFKFDIPKPADVCKFLKDGLDQLDGSKLEPIFAFSTAIPKLSSCKANTLKPKVKEALDKVMKDGGSSQDIFYASESLKASGNAVDVTKLGELLKTATKNDSPSSFAYAFWSIANNYKSGQKFDLWDRIEDVIAQSDEIENKYLQYEGGLSVTAPVVIGMIKLSEALNKQLTLTPDQYIKLGNYLVSRKTVTTPRGIWLFATSLDLLGSNKFSVPVFIGVSGSNILSDSNKIISVRGSDLLGRPLEISVQLVSVTNSKSKDGSKIQGLEFIQMLPSTTDKTLFQLDLKDKVLPKGFYNIAFMPKSTKNDKKLMIQEMTIEFKVIGKLGVVKARVGVADVDQESKVKWVDLNKGEKLPSVLSADPNQKFMVKFAASDSLHQVFVLLRNKETKKEVAFIAQPETEGKTDYKLDLDLATNAKDLNYKSGAYDVIIYLGDFLLEDSLEWNLGEVSLTVASGKPKSVNPLYSISYGSKPEIKHLFRVPEPRPPRFLSDAFTLLVLSPLLLLFILWIKVGANISGFPASLSALGFHLGLIGIFGVYGVFWWKLTMFEAIKYVTVPGLITFIAGHRLLSHISEDRILHEKQRG